MFMGRWSIAVMDDGIHMNDDLVPVRGAVPLAGGAANQMEGVAVHVAPTRPMTSP